MVIQIVSLLKICVIVPIITKSFIKEDTRKRVGKYARPDTVVDFIWVDYGPASIESRYDEVMSAPFVVKKAEWAEKNGYDAVVVSCMNDPGVKAAKEAVKIPVVGAGEAARQIAPLLGDNVVRVSARPLSVLELIENPEKAYQAILANAKKVLDGAQVIILTCTGLTGLAEKLQKEVGIPVLEGERLAIALAQMLVDAGLSQSKLAYRTPPKKKRILPGFEE